MLKRIMLKISIVINIILISNFMPNIFANLQKSYKPSRNAFDLSHYDISTTKPALMQPVLALHCLPGDKHIINASNFLQTMLPLKTDALFSAKQNLDYYFIPYQQVWSRFPEFYAQVEDPQKYNMAAFHEILENGVPHFDIIQFFITAVTLTQNPESMIRCFGVNEDMSATEVGYIYNTWFYGALRLLDLLGYGNYYPLVQAFISYDHQNHTQYTDFYTEFQQVRPANIQDYFERSIGSQVMVNALALGAYQRVWYNYYRNHFFDIDTENYTKIINFDYADTESGSIFDVLTDKETVQLFTMRFAPWKKDLYTGLYPDAQYGDVSVAPVTNYPDLTNVRINAVNFNSTGWKNVQTNTMGEVFNATDSDNVNRDFSISPNTVSGTFGISIPDLWAAEALQQWKQNVLRNGSKTSNQFEAHFGVKPHYVEQMYPDFLGSCDGQITSNRITSNASTGQNYNGLLGDVASNITSELSNKKIEFDCKDFGIILGIYYIRFEAQYNAYMLDEHNVHLLPTDFYIPEFQNIGLAPVYERSIDLVQASDNAVNPSVSDNVMGYAPRYIEYKTALNKVHGPLYSSYRYREGDNYVGEFSHWCVPRDLVVGSGPDSTSDLYHMSRFYQLPNVADSITTALDDGTYSTDFLLMGFNFNIKSIRPISVIGLPQF